MGCCCCDLISWSIVLVFVYFVVSKIISVLRIDRYTDAYVLITGCDTGFGNVAARRFDRMGCHVFAGCLTDSAKEVLKAECSERLHAISLDVTKPESVRQAYEYVKEHLPKGKGLWGVVNNAGVFGKLGSIEWFSLSDYRDVLDINLYGLIDVTMTFLPLVKKARGRIVNTASIVGRYSMPGSTPYCISKFGVEAFTDGLRRSLRPFGVKAVIVEPGTHKTHLTSTGNLTNLVKAAWDGATPEVQKEFGEPFFKESLAASLKLIDQLGSDKITDVVDAYEKGLFGRFPRARYLVGRDCYTFFMPMVWLPEWLGDWFLITVGKMPKPASLQ